jgi:bacillopeptidase F (M6 metalloprotease family)
MASIKSLKNPDNYFCECCNYETYSKKDFNKHILTAKHKKLENASKMLADSVKLSSYHNQQFMCNCGKSYAHDSSYYRHKKQCTYKDNNIVKEKEEEPTDKELILKILKQNSELIKENSELRKEQTDIKELILEIVKNGAIKE